MMFLALLSLAMTLVEWILSNKVGQESNSLARESNHLAATANNLTRVANEVAINALNLQICQGKPVNGFFKTILIELR